MALATAPPDGWPAACLGQARRPIAGEIHCGDRSGWWVRDGTLILALADGLGHGAAAQTAAVLALETVAETLASPRGPGPDLTALFARCDRALTDTRGAALALVQILPAADLIVHAAVGNIRTLIRGLDRGRRLGCARGIVGAGYRGLRPETLPLRHGDWLALYSDGIDENAAFDAWLTDRLPDDRLATALLAQFARTDDDAALLLYRHRSDPPS